MSQSYYWPPAGSNTSVASNGGAIPSTSTLIAGKNPSGNQTPVATDAGGNLFTTPLPGGIQSVNVQNVLGAIMSATNPVLSSTVVGGSVIDPRAIRALTSADVVTVVQATGANLNVAVSNFPATQPVSGTVAVSAIAGALPAGSNALGSVSVSNFPATQPVSGTVAVSSVSGSVAVTGTFFQATQPVSIASAVPVTGTFFQATQPVSAASLPLPTGAATSALQTTISGQLPATLGQKTSANSLAVVLASDQSTINAAAATPTAKTITQAAVTVGTSAVRMTVSGSAPASTRVVLVCTPDAASTAKFYVGSSSVTSTGGTRGIQITAGQVFTANNDAGDYYICSDTASQTVEIMEQS